jgi:hypothetical protein
MNTERGLFTLPPLDAKVPEYYSAMVEACRKDEPSTRPTAMQLLAMMPDSTIARSHASDEEMVHEQLDVASYQSCAISTKECDTCGALLSGIFYHCSSCGTGDYDLCSPCLEDGKHCEDIDHLLVELVISCGYPVVKKYFSSVTSSGLREVTVV